MYKNNNVEGTIIHCIYLDWVYTASVIKLALVDGASSHADARNKSYQFGLVNVRVGNHIYKKLMVVPTICKFVSFCPFYSKIGIELLYYCGERKKQEHPY